MGNSSWHDDHVSRRAADRAASNTPVFDHDNNVRTGKAVSSLHDKMNIYGKERESRDSVAHPESKAIGVMFDVTGSMQSVPTILQTKLKNLMSLLLRKGYCQHPQVLFGCIGDANCGSRAPLQVGQFESGIEMDDTFSHMFLEGGGGGTNHETYELAMYYFANRVKMDCLEKRGEKGYLFIIGDEMPYDVANYDKILSIIGVAEKGSPSTEEIVHKLKQKFEVFFIIPGGTDNYNNKEVQNTWEKLLGSERVLKIADPNAVCETIATTVGLLEGATDKDGAMGHLNDIGSSNSIVRSVADGVDRLAKSVALTKVGSASSSIAAKKSNTIEEL